MSLAILKSSADKRAEKEPLLIAELARPSLIHKDKEA
jgi:hypothetical protein